MQQYCMYVKGGKGFNRPDDVTEKQPLSGERELGRPATRTSGQLHEPQQDSGGPASRPQAQAHTSAAAQSPITRTGGYAPGTDRDIRAAANPQQDSNGPTGRPTDAGAERRGKHNGR